MLNFQSPGFLRRVLLVDAVSGIAMGLMLVAGQAVVVAVFAELEFFGVRRVRLAATA